MTSPLDSPQRENGPPAAGVEAVQEQLSAYLDGELDDETKRELETRLSSDAELRAELARMEKAWDMLDSLETPVVDQAFTASTMELVAMTAEADAADAEQLAESRRVRGRLLTGLSWLFMGLVGFVGVGMLWPSANDQLLHDLPILERLDAYRDVDSLEFLLALRDSGLFAKDAPSANDAAKTPGGDDGPVDVTPFALASEGDVNTRRERIESADLATKQLLLRKQEQLWNYTSDDRARIHSLHDAIMERDDAEELLGVMVRYSDWLSRLDSYKQNQLQELASDERIEEIKRQIDEARRRDNVPGVPELLREFNSEPVVEFLATSLDGFAEDALKLKLALPAHEAESALESIRDSHIPTFGRLMAYVAWNWKYVPPTAQPWFDENWLAEIPKRIEEPEVRLYLEWQTDEPMLPLLIKAIAYDQFKKLRDRDRSLTDKELGEFLEEGLANDRERDHFERIMTMSPGVEPDQMYRELCWEYLDLGKHMPPWFGDPNRRPGMMGGGRGPNGMGRGWGQGPGREDRQFDGQDDPGPPPERP